MFAVVKIGSSQFKVKEGDTITTDRIDADAGKDVTFDKVLMVSDGSKVQVGQPFLKTAKVEAKVLKEAKGEKLVTLKYRRRKDSATKSGHRAKLTDLNIVKITA